LLAAPLTAADEGMWLYNAPPLDRIEKVYGFRPTQQWLDHLRLSSVRFNNGGSGSFVSAEGLTMTNHHVGSDCIQGLSSKEKDYMAAGFLAEKREDEGRCPDLELNVLMSITDVTAEVNNGLKPEMDAGSRSAAQRAAMARIEKQCTTDTGLRCDVVVLYEGGAFHLYRYKKFTDVRLVFAPEEKIAAFGGDPDNFNFPRYDLDMAFFRVYENNRPAKTPHFLKWSAGGPKEGEVAFVSGNPGSTGRQLTMTQLEFLRDTVYPHRLELFSSRLKRLHDYAAQNAEQARRARDVILTYENSYKAYTGFQSGLKDPKLMAERARREKTMREAVAARADWQKEYGGTWDAIAQAEKTYQGFFKEYQLLEGSIGLRQSELFQKARHLLRMPVEKAKPSDQRLREYRDSNLASLEQGLYSEAPIYKDLEALVLGSVLAELQSALGKDDPLIKQVLDGGTPDQAAARYVNGSHLDQAAERRKPSENDPMVALARAVDARARDLRKRFEDQVDAVERKNGSLLAKALFSTQGASQYPEATFTLRLSYGAVKGYVENGKKIPFTTDFTGLYKRATGQDPYKLPQRWVNRRREMKLETPYNFVLTADIIGGNSGSPVVNRNGEVTGLIFDGNIQSLPNRFLYTDEVARSVAVHSEGIMEALRSMYEAWALVSELKGK
jgi:hypothetical protein